MNDSHGSGLVNLIDEPITDEELTALALAADPDEPIDAGATPLRWRDNAASLLPDWYMPSPVATGVGRARRWVLGGFVVALLVINGCGLCVTYGFPEIAW